jgi:hypothetical protein
MPGGNPDKEWHEHWYEGRSLGAIPHPFCALMFGGPNSGKGTLAVEIMKRHQEVPRKGPWRPFMEVYVCHPDPDGTKEWPAVDGYMKISVDELPDPSQLDPDIKTLLIIDDINFHGLSKSAKEKLDRLLGYGSMHKNLSIIICVQDPFSVPSQMRSMCNVVSLWRTGVLDFTRVSQIASRIGVSAEDLRRIFALFESSHDSLTMDFTDGTPAPYRMNLFEPLAKH